MPVTEVMMRDKLNLNSHGLKDCRRCEEFTDALVKDLTFLIISINNHL